MDCPVQPQQQQRAGEGHLQGDDGIKAVQRHRRWWRGELPFPPALQGLLRGGDTGQGQPLALREKVVVADKGGGGLDIVPPVQEVKQLLEGGVQLSRRFGAEFGSVLRAVAAGNSLRGGSSFL